MLSWQDFLTKDSEEYAASAAITQKQVTSRQLVHLILCKLKAVSVMQWLIESQLVPRERLNFNYFFYHDFLSDVCVSDGLVSLRVSIVIAVWNIRRRWCRSFVCLIKPIV